MADIVEQNVALIGGEAGDEKIDELFLYDKTDESQSQHDFGLNSEENLETVDASSSQPEICQDNNSTVELESTQSLTPARVKPLVPCKYFNCGCQELVTRGTFLEKDHYQHCEFRPLHCLMETNCKEKEIPYHDFILHHLSHNIQPNYTLNLTANIVIKKQDFEHDQQWTPKWLSAHGNHFFLNLIRKTPGVWASWVCMFGNHTQASRFLAQITYFKGLRSFGGAFPVHSIRACQLDMESDGTCLLATDATVLNVTQIDENIMTDFSVHVQIVLNTGNPAEAIPSTSTMSTSDSITESLANTSLYGRSIPDIIIRPPEDHDTQSTVVVSNEVFGVDSMSSVANDESEPTESASGDIYNSLDDELTFDYASDEETPN